MERYDKVLAEISVPTHNLQIKAVQDLLKFAKEATDDAQQFWNEVSSILWNHIKTGFKLFDDQLLSATCFYTVITHTEKQDFYLSELLKLVEDELDLKRNNKEQSVNTNQVVSMMYGIFQSTFLTQQIHDNSKITSVLKQIFNLLLLMGYDYSKYTYICFKTMKLFKKVCSTNLQECIFNKENQIKLLNFVNHNWENPITGIRDLNRSVFQILISTLDNEMYGIMLKEINSFYWNKAKYLMLSEIIEHRNGNIILLVLDNKWIDGLIYSLYKPGLVSAGADMYYALLKHINFINDWSVIFLKDVNKILNGNSSKAIENFNNFWCLPTLKKFPELSDTLLVKLSVLEESESNLCSKLCIIKQANKLSILENNWCNEKSVLTGLEHCNYYIRLSAFNIVCISHRKMAPSEVEYNLILDFLHNNVNSDCTVLRLSMLNSSNIYFAHLHSTFLNVLIKDKGCLELQHLLEFCKKLQNFIVNSLNFNGNYQRKITSVKLCDSLLSCFSEIPKKKRGQARKSDITLIEYLKENGYWIMSSEEFVYKLVSLLKDPTDDIRENVIKLLHNHYSAQLQERNILQQLVNDALKCMKSKFFYEISCGQSMFKLLTNLICKEKNSTAEFKSVEDIFHFAYNSLITEYRANTNIMESIETGKQLHSFMSILLVVLETCISNSYNIDIQNIMPEFIDALKSISNQFSWEEESSTSSDFSKMNEMVENIIVNSGYNHGDGNDPTKISSLHQIVLNSLWLNVKASCDLASLLVQYNVGDASMCEKCLNIITHVLETSRHKGAIEAAGASLGRAIQFLTSLREENRASEVPNTLLQCKLNDLISETNKMTSITRRGAGLSIMVHRIVSNDMKRGKPLFHYFMNSLLEICNRTEDSLKTTDDNIENQIDLPKAIYIHFLTRIVTDSSLASDMMFYFTKLAELAFGNLTCPHWQIRNAALQLYGALIPKQIGEKKASGSDEETIATVACDELRTHSPKLWQYILNQLEHIIGTDKVQSHSNLVPILNLLGNCAKRYNFSYDVANQKTMSEDLLKHLVLLLNSPIHTVRRLTAKCIFNMYDFEIIYEVLLNQDFVSENYLHGCLILVQLCHKYYTASNMHEEKFQSLFHRFSKIFCKPKHSFICKRLFEDIFIQNIKSEEIERTILEMNRNLHHPGVQLWAESRIQKYLLSCSSEEIPSFLNILLKQSDYEKYTETVFLKIKTQSFTEKVLLEIADILISFENKYSTRIIWKILYTISLKTNLSAYLDTSDFLKNIKERDSMYILRYIIPLVARNICITKEDVKINLMKIINELSDFKNSDVDMRYIAAIANNELAYQFDLLSDKMKVISIKCAVMLLQDEDEDIRNLSVNFYARLSKQKVAVQPYICLQNILNRQFLYTIFTDSQSSINDLIKNLTEILKSNNSIDEYNPFANDSKNIYLEPEVLKQLIQNLNK